MGAGNFSL